MKKTSAIKKHVAAVTAGLAIAACAFTPLSAFAAAQSTEVTIQAANGSNGQTGSDENLAFSTPTVIPFAVKADGTMATADASALKIQNKSIFPIHVTNMAVAEAEPFHLVADVTESTGTNDFQFTVHGTPAAATVNLAANTAWNMGYQGSATDSITLDTTNAKIARITSDLSSAKKAATITWTLAAGAAA